MSETKGTKTKIECKLITKEQEDLVHTIEELTEKLVDLHFDSFDNNGGVESVTETPYTQIRTIFFADKLKDFHDALYGIVSAVDMCKEDLDRICEEKKTNIEDLAMRTMFISVSNRFEGKTDEEVLEHMSKAVQRAKDELNKNN